MKRLISLVVLPIGLILLLTGCASSSQQPSTNINVTMTDFEFYPRSFTVPAGQSITLRAQNNGAVEHTFVIMQAGIRVVDKFSDTDLPNIYWQTKLAPGESRTETFTAPAEPGEYQVVCDTPGHFQAGMLAKLIVK